MLCFSLRLEPVGRPNKLLLTRTYHEPTYRARSPRSPTDAETRCRASAPPVFTGFTIQEASNFNGLVLIPVRFARAMGGSFAHQPRVLL
jgi:hypothetical protein